MAFYINDRKVEPGEDIDYVMDEEARNAFDAFNSILKSQGYPEIFKNIPFRSGRWEEGGSYRPSTKEMRVGQHAPYLKGKMAERSILDNLFHEHAHHAMNIDPELGRLRNALYMLQGRNPRDTLEYRQKYTSDPEEMVARAVAHAMSGIKYPSERRNPLDSPMNQQVYKALKPYTDLQRQLDEGKDPLDILRGLFQ